MMTVWSHADNVSEEALSLDRLLALARAVLPRAQASYACHCLIAAISRCSRSRLCVPFDCVDREGSVVVGLYNLSLSLSLLAAFSIHNHS